MAKFNDANVARNIAGELRRTGHRDVRADLPSEENNPPKLEGRIPDVTGKKNGLNIVEIENEATLGGEHSRKQLQAFERYKRRNGGQITLVVPRGRGEAAKRWLRSIRVTATVRTV